LSGERKTINSAYCKEYDRVENLMFSQEGAPWTHQSVLKISRNIGIPWSSYGRTIHDRFRTSHPLKGKQRAYFGC